MLMSIIGDAPRRALKRRVHADVSRVSRKICGSYLKYEIAFEV